MDSEANADTSVTEERNEETVIEKTKESSSFHVAESSSLRASDMADSDFIKTTEQFKFNFKLGKKSKNMSEEERNKICDMVAGLAKYNDLEVDLSEDDLLCPPKQKKGKSPRRSGTQGQSSLGQLIDSELASLHSKGELNEAKADKKANKSGAHVASVCAEKQLQFETMLKEDLASVTLGVEDLHISAGARPKIKVEPEVDLEPVQKASNQQNQTEESAKGSPKKKNKKSPKKKG